MPNATRKRSSFRRTRRRQGCVTASATASARAAPVERTSVSRGDESPAPRIAFETVPLTPHMQVAASTIE